MRKESYLAKKIDEEYKKKKAYEIRKNKEDFKESNAFLNNMVDDFINDMKEEKKDEEN